MSPSRANSSPRPSTPSSLIVARVRSVRVVVVIVVLLRSSLVPPERPGAVLLGLAQVRPPLADRIEDAGHGGGGGVGPALRQGVDRGVVEAGQGGQLAQRLPALPDQPGERGGGRGAVSRH